MKLSILRATIFPVSAVASMFGAVPGALGQAVWPVAGPPVVTRSFGSLEDSPPTVNGEIHGGLDIPAARGSEVRAVVKSKIVKITKSGTKVTGVIAEDPDGNQYIYYHIKPLDGKTLTVGQDLAKGQAFAQITGANDPASGSFGHLHFGYSRKADGGFVANRANGVDPLRYLFPANTVSESLENRSMTYNPRDRKFPIYGQTGPARVRGRYIKGNVDLMGEMRDDMGGTKFAGTESDASHLGTDINLFKGYSGTPFQMRYSVREPSYVRDGAIPERTLETFDQRERDHQAKAHTTYVHRERTLTSGDPGAAAGERGGNGDNYTYRLTATDGTRPDDKHYWNTDALRDTGGPDASGAGAKDTRFNALAAFQDGVYEVYGKSLTVNGFVPSGTGLVSLQSEYDVLLNNYLQTAYPAKRLGEAPPNLALLSNERNPGPEQINSPGIEDTFLTGQDIFIKGAQYVDDLTYYAFAVPYQATWTQGDLFNWVCRSIVRSDQLGVIDGQLLCPGGLAPGEYNLIVDYDRSFDYSWTLDGVGTFDVVAPHAVPEPSIAAFPFAIAVIATTLRWTLRRRIQSLVPVVQLKI